MTKKPKPEPLRFEGLSVSRVLSRGYADRGGDLKIKVLASHTKRDGTVELVSIWLPLVESGVTTSQTTEEHAARTTFMLMWNLLTLRADEAIQRANNGGRNAK